MTTEEQLRVIMQVTGAKDVEEAIGKLKEMGEAAEEAGEKSTGAGDKLGRAMQVGSSALQLWQGDVDGFVSNLGPLVLALGGSGGLAAVIAGVGQAAVTAYPYVRDYYKAWTDGSNEIPKAVSELDSLNDRLKETKSQLDELRTHTFLTNTELQQFNILTAEQTKLEGQLADQRAAASVGAAGSKAQSARARAVREAMAEAGGSEALANDLNARTKFTPAEARQIIASALRGSESSIDFLRSTLPQFGANYTSPEQAQRQKDAEELTAQGERFAEETRRQYERDKEQDARDDEQRTAVGHRNEEAWRRGMEREKEQEAREAERAKTKAEQAKARADRDAERQKERQDREAERARAKADLEQAKADKETIPTLHDPAEMASLQAEAALIGMAAQADVMMGNRTPIVARMEAIANRLMVLQQRMSRLNGVAGTTGGYSSQPTYW